MADEINLVRAAFRSRIVRELIGERTVDIFSSLTQPEQPGQAQTGGIGGIVQSVFGIGRRLVGFLLNQAANAVGWLLGNLWDICVESYFEFVNFDWNQTDAEIEASIQANNVQIAAALGNLAGTGLVWLASVGVAAALTIKFPVVSARVALRLAEEGGEEIRASLINVITISRNAAARSRVLGSLLNARRLRLFGLSPVTERKDPWTIAQAVEEQVERIPSPTIRAFVENALESIEESIIEVGYVVSYALDDYYQSSRLAAQNQLGQERAIRIQPDNRVEGENLVLTGPQSLVIQQTQQALTTHRFIYNRDVGQIVGIPALDFLRGKFQRRKLTLIFKSRPAPPWRGAPGEERTKEVQVSIPEAKRGLTWREIKTAAQPYTWGKFRATANLSEGRQMAVYGSTEAEAERTLRRMLTLTTLEILTLSVSEEKDRNPSLRKEATQIYPAYATLLIRRETGNPEGRTSINNESFAEQVVRMELWLSEEPVNLPPLG